MVFICKTKQFIVDCLYQLIMKLSKMDDIATVLKYFELPMIQRGIEV